MYKSLFEKNKGISFPSSNYSIIGFGRDVNGNKIIKIITPSGKGFSIQTNKNLPNTHRIRNKIKELDKKQLKVIEKEVLDYIKKFSTSKMK